MLKPQQLRARTHTHTPPTHTRVLSPRLSARLQRSGIGTSSSLVPPSSSGSGACPPERAGR